MSVIEELIVVLGISLEVFGTMECRGSLVAKIDKKKLFPICTVMAVSQAMTLGIGSYVSLLLCHRGMQKQETFLGQIMSAAIFFFLGLRLLLKAWREEGIVERREESPHWREILGHYGRSIGFSLLAGLGLGFLGSSIPMLLVLAVAVTVLVMIVGLYTGYYLGFEHRMKAYILGGLLLLAQSAEVIARYILL